MWPPAVAPDGMTRRHVWGFPGLCVAAMDPQPAEWGPGWVTEDGAWGRGWACFARKSSTVFHFIGPSGPLYTMSMFRIFMSVSGFSWWARAFSILWITSNPCVARPKTVCFPSSHG